MKFIAPRLAVLSLIGRLQGIVPTRPVIPAVGNILLEAKEDQLILGATDLAISARAYAEAQVVEEGAIALPSRRLFQLIRELTVPYLEMETSSPDTIFIHAGSSRFKLQGLHHKEFPLLPPFTCQDAALLSPTELRRLLKCTAFAAAREDDRHILSAVCLIRQQQHLLTIATDGRRLVKLSIPFNSLAFEEGHHYILPMKTVEQILSILDEKEPQIKLTLSKDTLHMESGNVQFSSKLVPGPYPDVLSTIPTSSLPPLTIHREELITLLRQISLFSPESAPVARFAFTSGALYISTASGEIGEGKVDMPVNYSGPRLEIGFNPRHFLDALYHTEDQAVHLEVSGPYSPAIITDSCGALFMLMPMRIDLPQPRPVPQLEESLTH